MTMRYKKGGLSAAASLLAFISFICVQTPAAAQNNKPSSAMNQTDAAELARYRAKESEETKNLANFDDLDYNVYSNQRWDQLPKSHAKDIIVHYPDGSTTKGLPNHIEKLKPMFVFAPDTRIKHHPIRIADGNMTAVVGIMEGTFTHPMPAGNGKTIAPTGKPFRLKMTTIGIWENGVMKEEHLFWDNHALMQQIGIVP